MHVKNKLSLLNLLTLYLKKKTKHFLDCISLLSLTHLVLAEPNRMASNSQRYICPCLLSTRIKDKYHMSGKLLHLLTCYVVEWGALGIREQLSKVSPFTPWILRIKLK